MPSVRQISILPPLGGKVRRTSLEHQSPATCYDSRDFWPVDTKTNMDRWAVRPGFLEYEDLIGATHDDVKLIATLNVAPSETLDRVLITASGTNVYHWTGETKTLATMTASIANTSRNFQAAPYLGKLFIADDTAVRLYTHTSTAVTTPTPTDGSFPTNCRLICTWANRLVCAGDTSNPHLWYMSRIGDPHSWLYAADDASSPVAATSVDGGQIGEPITSLVPHNLACILFGSANSITVLRGNPTHGGRLETISHVTGPVNATAWCKTADDWKYFLTRDGLYKMPPGCGVMPTSVSREKIPQSLVGLDGVTDLVYMAYDVRFRCIHIYVTGNDAQYWHYFPEYEAFCPVTAPGSSILAVARHDPIETATQSGVLIGTSSGLMRLDSDTALGGSSGAYWKQLIPFDRYGSQSKIVRAMLKFGDNTDDTNADVYWYAGNSAEAAAAGPVSRKASSKVYSYQGEYAVQPGIGGSCAELHVAQNNTGSHISFEGGLLDVAQRGKARV